MTIAQKEPTSPSSRESRTRAGFLLFARCRASAARHRKNLIGWRAAAASRVYSESSNAERDPIGFPTAKRPRLGETCNGRQWDSATSRFVAESSSPTRHLSPLHTPDAAALSFSGGVHRPTSERFDRSARGISSGLDRVT